MATTSDTTGRRDADTARGFPGLRCIRCGEPNTLHLFLVDMTMECSSCDESYGPEDVRATIAAWTRVLAWIDQAPIVD